MAPSSPGLTVDRAKPDLSAPGLRSAQRVAAPVSATASATTAGIDPDPAWDYKGLLWDYRRMGLPAGWAKTAGSPAVTVGVADTGLDYTHAELASKVVQVLDCTVLEGDEPICKTLFGQSDQDLAAEFGGPANGDWNGHGHQQPGQRHLGQLQAGQRPPPAVRVGKRDQPAYDRGGTPGSR